MYFYFFLVLTIGILHGANDILILSKNKNTFKRKLRYLSIYVSIILLAILIYLVSPVFAILAFILISAYHFGEEHFSNQKLIGFYFDTFYFLVYGLFIFLSLFYTSIDEVNAVLNELVDFSFSLPILKISLLITTGLLIIGSLFIYYRNKETANFLILEFFYLFFLSLIFRTNSLIFGFAIYFIFWHSIPSILNQINFLTESFTKKSILYYLKQAMIYWIISVLSLVVLYKFYPSVELFSTILFVVLFAVTAPHIWVMYRMKN